MIHFAVVFGLFFDKYSVLQFPLPHTRGSSHGHSRTLRKAYTSSQWYYSKMVPDAVNLWRELEAEAGPQIFKYESHVVIFTAVQENKSIDQFGPVLTFHNVVLH